MYNTFSRLTSYRQAGEAAQKAVTYFTNNQLAAGQQIFRALSEGAYLRLGAKRHLLSLRRQDGSPLRKSLSMYKFVRTASPKCHSLSNYGILSQETNHIGD